MPDLPQLTVPDAVAALLSMLVACAAAAVAWALARRARTPHPALSLTWSLGGSVALGTALWASHGLAAMAWHPGFWATQGLLPAATSWAVALAMSALGVIAASRIRPDRLGRMVCLVILVAGWAFVSWISRVLPMIVADGTWTAALVAVAALLLLAPAYLAARLDEHLQTRAGAMARKLREANEELQRAVFHDGLTQLPNRRLMLERLQAIAQRCDAGGTQAALLFIDLDGFKPVNDLFGHGFGDAVLCEISHRLLSVAREGDTVARLGGDEFAILLADIGSAEAAQQLAQRAVTAIQAPIQLARREARLSASVGIAVYPGDGAADKLLAAADAAMYEAKRGGGGQAMLFASRMEADARAQVEMQRDLRRAIEHPERGELSLHYQPKVSARDGRVTGMEALLRWRHPEHGMVGPGVFVPVAERFGLIDRLGNWVIDEACRQIGTWQRQGLRLRVAVNLSMHQLRQPGLVDRVRLMLVQHGVAPGSLMFEITESVAMDENDATGRVFDELAALGTELSIDDFGTGYSSLAYLRRLPSRQIKIDRSFVMDLDTCSDALAIVEAVIRLAHALGLAVVAEGVETEAQRDLLRQLQCDEFQGYLFARPVPGDTVLRWSLGLDRPAMLHFDAPPVPAPAIHPPDEAAPLALQA
ncbi:MAG: bifunctional diguanylate cyclase/phosphodiesterase [Aquabacterium sp.]|nr:bifunctional diguanylate cyclase/phosphodiesterase [Aquabacterium sp.]